MFPMKNKYCIYLLLVLPFLSVAQALQGSVIYKKEPVASEKHIGPIVFVSNKPIKSVYDALRYELKFNAKEALFSMIDNMERDDNRFNSYVFRSGGGNGTYYTSLDCNYSLRQVEYIGELFLVKMDHPTFTITNETKIIGNYECRQAIVTGINKAPNKDLKDTQYAYSVWFTPDIPVALGPIHFDGFPGLVLQVDLGPIRWTATELNLSTEDDIIIEKPVKGIPIAQKDLGSTTRKMIQAMGAPFDK
ncbi:MAG TPA: hypothetical protein DIV44_01780 [Leeuwenhoekiella sp.]|nr:hypothetical protein [Leeuwenhoekiella sp.]HAX16261.1 hypothetical protein [Leeuwenhoekiella sp.]HBO29692.1 hypothetical protein [Leeuwenhoekiella sp.]HCQ75513.1 hypothetical protein [Leeuwenhoekiella sp.]|tara:strand:- start:335 stop:1075 length:741 start_codon:yes stop_codon:yes gene_type:complete